MLASGTQLGRYAIAAPLGTGGMGEVYRATDSRLDRQVAIKVLPPQFVQDQARLARFEREAKVVAALSHPNILAIHDFVTEQGQTFAVMELLEGETLRSRVARGAIPFRKAVEIAVAIADGLAAAHAKGIIHRDLKPENIFLTIDGRVKILDFGLARIKPTSPSGDSPTGTYHPDQTEAGTILGTVGYMSPEQVRGQEADGTSDVFSLGCMLYEMVVCQRAFSGNTAVETMAAILHDEPPELADSGKKVPLELERVIQHCLEKSPAARFHSAHDLAYALRAIQPDSKALEKGFPKGVLLGAGALALAFVAALALWFNNRRPVSVGDRAFESVAVLPFENVTGDPKAEPLSDGIADHLSINLSQLRDRDFKVTPFTSASRFRGPKVDLKTAGSALGVQAVVTGKLYQEGESLSINVALSDARTDNLIWGQQYRGKRSEILALQDEMAKGLVDHLGLRLSDADERRLLKHHTEDPRAYVLYQEGMYHWHKFTEESTRTAIDYFQRAIKIDPQFALAYEGLGRCYGLQSPPKESYPKAKEAYEQALKLDGSLAEAHAGMGNYLMFYDHNWPAAEIALKEALRLNPRLSDAHHLYGFYLAAMGQISAAVAELKIAKELDPQTPIRCAGLALVHFLARQYDQQLAESQKMLELAPNFPLAYLNMGEAYALQGMYEQAVLAFQKQLAIDKNDTASFGLLGYTYARWGKRAEAERILREITDLSERQYFSGFERARIYAGLGEKDQAFLWLEKAYEERDWGVAWLKVDPTLDSLRSDPRFDDLLRRMGLADKAVGHEQNIQSVAVLPLENVGDDPETEFLSDGLADQIIDSLLQVRRQNLKVRPFTSVSQYKGQKPHVQTIARDLNVQAIVMGSLHQQGNDLSIGVELVDAREDSILWSKRYQGKLSGILDLQDEIARDVAANLRLRLTGEEDQRLAKRFTDDPEAYLLYREATYHWNKFTEEGLNTSIEYCRRALKKDPNYAAAYAQLGRCYVLLGTVHLGPRKTFSEARTYLAKALSIDETLAEAHAGMGLIYLFHDWDWQAAERELKQAAPSDPSRAVYGFYLAAIGRPTDALPVIRQLQELNPHAAPHTNEVAMAYNWLRQYDQAIAEAQKALELDPNFPLAHAELGIARVQKGMYDEAIVGLVKAIGLGQRHPRVKGVLGYAYAMAGNRGEAKKVLEELTELSQGRFGFALSIARIHAARGDKDQAFEWLQKACDELDSNVIFLNIDPTLDSLRNEPRFQKIVADMKFPE